MASRFSLPPYCIGYPFPSLRGVIQVEHGRHRIHPQPVGVVSIEPEEGAADEEGLHFIAAMIENIAVPFRMKPLLRVRMLIQMGSVKKDKSVLVAGKMRRHPVEDDADSVLVQPIDEIHEILWRAIPAVGAK